jgi:hypothetical protein
MRKRYAIEYELKPRSVRIFWAYREGTKKEAEDSARGLLYSLRCGHSYKKARVFIEGKSIRLRPQDIEMQKEVDKNMSVVSVKKGEENGQEESN